MKGEKGGREEEWERSRRGKIERGREGDGGGGGGRRHTQRYADLTLIQETA